MDFDTFDELCEETLREFTNPLPEHPCADKSYAQEMLLLADQAEELDLREHEEMEEVRRQYEPGHDGF